MTTCGSTATQILNFLQTIRQVGVFNKTGITLSESTIYNPTVCWKFVTSRCIQHSVLKIIELFNAYISISCFCVWNTQHKNFTRRKRHKKAFQYDAYRVLRWSPLDVSTREGRVCLVGWVSQGGEYVWRWSIPAGVGMSRGLLIPRTWHLGVRPSPEIEPGIPPPHRWPDRRYWNHYLPLAIGNNTIGWINSLTNDNLFGQTCVLKRKFNKTRVVVSGDGRVLVVHMEDLNRLRWYVGLTMSASFGFSCTIWRV